MCICTPPVNYCNHCGNNVDCCKVSTHFPSMTSLLISTPTSLECHSVIQPISPMKFFWYLTISPYRPVISQGDNLGELQGPLWQGKARQGGMLVANIKTFWSRVTFADCCQHPPAFLLQRIRVVSQPVGGRCVRKKLARRRKSLRWGRSRWGKEKILSTLFLLLLDKLCHKKELDWKMQLLLVLTFASQQTCWRKRDCAQSYIAGLPTIAMNTTNRETLVQRLFCSAWFYHPSRSSIALSVFDPHPRQSKAKEGSLKVRVRPSVQIRKIFATYK